MKNVQRRLPMAKWKDESMAGLLSEIQNETENWQTTKKIKISQLIPFKDHPFKLYQDEKMLEMIQSVEEYGILNPILVRKKNENQYEIISGHNRWEAAKRIGLQEIPAIIRELDDETATILMVDSNFYQRDEILPSEKAFAYQMKLMAMKQQGKRTDLEATYGQDVQKTTSRDLLSKESGDSGRQIQRYIRLTYLIPPLLERVDKGKLAFIVAVELSYLKKEEQVYIDEVLEVTKVSINKLQAQELRAQSKEQKLTTEETKRILKSTQQEKFMGISIKQFKALLPDKIKKNITAEQANHILEEAIALWCQENEGIL